MMLEKAIKHLFLQIFFLHIKITRQGSGKYYQKSKKRLKKSRKVIKMLQKRKKQKEIIWPWML